MKTKLYEIPDSFIDEICKEIALVRCTQKDIHHRLEDETEEECQKRVEMTYDHEHLMVREQFYKFIKN